MSGSSTRDYGTFVAKRRKRLGWTQAELAREAGVLRQVVAAVETGRTTPSLTTLERLATALGTQTWRIVRSAERGF
jgi:transcriptional regulator with XRE-family HTH domain